MVCHCILASVFWEILQLHAKNEVAFSEVVSQDRVEEPAGILQFIPENHLN